MGHETCEIRGPIHLLTAGRAGPPVVLVHGLDGSAATWVDLLDHLDDDHRLVACDLPGFGRSPRGRHRGSLEAHATLVGEVVRRSVGGPAVLVGHAMGAVVAMLAAARHPQTASAVVLLTPALPRRGAGAVDASLAPLLLSTLLPGMLHLEPWRRSWLAPEERVQALLEPGYARDGPRASAAAMEEMVAAVTAQRRRDHLPAWSRAARSLLWWLGRPDRFHGSAEDVRVPVTLVEGMWDPVVPRTAVHATLDRHPAWTHVGLAGVGHLPHLERPSAVASTVRAAAR